MKNCTEEEITAKYIKDVLEYRILNIKKDKSKEEWETISEFLITSWFERWLNKFQLNGLLKEWLVVFDETVWQPIEPSKYKNIVKICLVIKKFGKRYDFIIDLRKEK